MITLDIIKINKGEEDPMLLFDQYLDNDVWKKSTAKYEKSRIIKLERLAYSTGYDYYVYQNFDDTQVLLRNKRPR